jgi:hypothetical protein
MIRIITPGKTDFRMTCDKCGCVFEYNVEDIDDGYIKCPTCGKMHYGFQDTQLSDVKPTGTFRISTDDYDCSNCDFAKTLKTTGYYVGDTPCQWCSKSPYRSTCTITSLGSGYSSGCTCSSRDYSEHNCECESASYEPTCNVNGGTSDCCEPTYTYSQYAEPCSYTDGKEFFTCTAEGVNYEFTSDSLGAYESSSFTIDLPKEEDLNK